VFCVVYGVVVDVNLNDLSVVVSMEYVMTLKDFFEKSLPLSSSATSAPTLRPGQYRHMMMAIMMMMMIVIIYTFLFFLKVVTLEEVAAQVRSRVIIDCYEPGEIGEL